MRIDKFRQSDHEQRRYVCNYEDWLNENETIMAVTMTGNVIEDPFAVSGYTVDTGGKQVIYYISGGLAGKSYDVGIEITTSFAQVKNDTITFVVTE